MSIDPFEPYRIGRLELRNRFVRSAMGDVSVDRYGAFTDHTLAVYQGLAEGGVGLIIAPARVSPRTGVLGRGWHIDTDEMIPSQRRLVQVVHQGAAKIALQLDHSGNKFDVKALSVTEMTEEDIETLVSDFASAAVRAREAGFDAVQLHGAHGHLMCQFLSPLSNCRTDRWGGSTANRRRFHFEVIRRVRQAVGADFPLMIKFGIQDDKEGGLSLTEGLEVARQMAEKGIDAIEISAGIASTLSITTYVQVKRKGDPTERAYFRAEATAVKRVVTVPVMVVGGIRSLEMAKNIVDSGDGDLISMCRPLIREPGLIRRWQRGDVKPSKCISCNKCYTISMASGEPVECEEERELRRLGKAVARA